MVWRLVELDLLLLDGKWSRMRAATRHRARDEGVVSLRKRRARFISSSPRPSVLLLTRNSQPEVPEAGRTLPRRDVRRRSVRFGASCVTLTMGFRPEADGERELSGGTAGQSGLAQPAPTILTRRRSARALSDPTEVVPLSNSESPLCGLESNAQQGSGCTRVDFMSPGRVLSA
jgi:hypothetical protein